MIKLDFVMKSSFECPNDEAGDAAFVKVTHTIDGQDAVEEYVSCRLFPSSVSFDLGEIADGETPVEEHKVCVKMVPTDIG
jgi:hypothetical protein